MENGTDIDVQTNSLTSAKKVIPIELSNDPKHSQNGIEDSIPIHMCIVSKLFWQTTLCFIILHAASSYMTTFTFS